MAKDKDREIKPVSFNKKNVTDLKILKYLEENQIKFTSYVKQLIYNDINEKSTTESNESNLNDVLAAINKLGDIIGSNNGLELKKPLENNVSNEDQESKNIIKNILNMH